MPVPEYEIEFYEDEHGDAPVLRWLREELSPRKRRALGTAMNRVLQVLGVGVCDTKFGRQLRPKRFTHIRLPLRLAAAPPRGEIEEGEHETLDVRGVAAA